MSVEQINSFLFTDLEQLDNPPCFYCGKPCDQPDRPRVVVWKGHPTTLDERGLLILHQGCAEKLALQLIQDAALAKAQNKVTCDLRVEGPYPNNRQSIIQRIENRKGK